MGNPSSGRGLSFLGEGQAGRLLLWLPVAVGFGAALYIKLPLEPGLVAWLACAAGLIGSSLLIGRFPVLALIAAFLGGFLWTGFRAHLADAPAIVTETPPLTITAYVEDVDLRGQGKLRLILSNLVIEGGLWGSAKRAMPDGLPSKIRVTVRQGDGPQVLPGMTVRGKMILRAPPGPIVPGGYDFAREAYFDGIGAVGFSLGAVEIVGIGAPTLQGRLTQIRTAITARIDESLTGDRGALASALLTGFRGPVDEGVLTDLRNAGLAHLLAISGLHIGLVAGSVFLVLRLLLVVVMLVMRHLRPDRVQIWPTKQIAAGAALIVAALYLGLSGMNVPAQRAFIMTGLALMAIMMNRTAISLRLVAWAALIVIAIHPQSVLQAGFQMSFAAVAALVAVYEYLRPHSSVLFGTTWLTKGRGYIVGLIITSLVAGLATGPIAAFHFGRVALFGLLGNLAAMPVMGIVIMPAGITALVLMPFGLEAVPLQIMGAGIVWVTQVAGAVAGLDHAERLTASAPDAALFLIVIGGLFLCLWVGRTRLLGLLPILIGMIVWQVSPPPQILISEGGKVIMVDDQVTDTRRFGYTKKHLMQYRGLSPDHMRVANCDRVGCVFKLPHDAGELVQLFQHDGLVDACSRAEIIVAPFRVWQRNCAGSLIIDTSLLITPDALSIDIAPDRGLSLSHSETGRFSRRWGRSSNPDYLADRLGNVTRWNDAARLQHYHQ